MNGTRPIFTYNAVGLQDITEVSATLFVDVNPGTTPAETQLGTSVYLRNQNRAPTALFSVEVVEQLDPAERLGVNRPRGEGDDLHVEDRQRRRG